MIRAGGFRQGHELQIAIVAARKCAPINPREREEQVTENTQDLQALKEAAEAAAKEAERLEAAAKEAAGRAAQAQAALKEALAKSAAKEPAPEKKAPPKPPVSGDPVTIQMLNLAQGKNQPTIYDRAAKMKPCNIGTEGICCKNCSQGPCRLPISKGIKDGTEADTRTGLCGATPETIVARNLARMISGGAAAHSEHALDVVEAFLDMACGQSADYAIKDEKKLRRVAAILGVPESDSRGIMELAKDTAEAAMAQWGQQHGELAYLKLAPKGNFDRWTRLGLKPRGINREAVEIMHRTHMGVDQDFKNLLFQGARCALSDGWSSSMMATDFQDIIFGPPLPRSADLNLGALSADKVNVVLHGQYPLMAEKIIEAAELPELIEYAKNKGADGFKVTGICCTGNEIQGRHGLAGIGDYLQQELAVVTGAVEAVVIDAQCAMEGLSDICDCYHTKLITTMNKARLASGKNTVNLMVNELDMKETAKDILKLAADNFPRRGQFDIPEVVEKMTVGHSVESLGAAMKANGSGPLSPLARLLSEGRIKGVVGLIGCNNARQIPGESRNDNHVDLAKELIKQDILVLTTGCAAMACGRAGLLCPEAAKEAGEGLAKFCLDTGLPPVIHLGSCVDNSRLMGVLAELSRSGDFGDDLSALPAAVAAPGWTTEQIVSVGFYFAVSGIKVMLGFPLPIGGSPIITKYLSDDFAQIYGGSFDYEPNPLAAAQKLVTFVRSKQGRMTG